MLEKCPLCDRQLRIGSDTIRKEYDPEYRAKFEAGEIDLDELLGHVRRYRVRTMVCPNEGNNNKAIRESEMYKYSGMSQEEAITRAEANGDTYLLNPPCQNFYGRNNGTLENPFVVVETITVEDN